MKKKNISPGEKIDCSRIASGIYFLQVDAQNILGLKQLVISK
jgi:hypothetical protein